MKQTILITLNSAEQLGGVEKHVANLIKGLRQYFKFIICCKNGPAVVEYKKLGAEYFNLYPRLDFDPLYIFRIVKLIKTFRPIVLHSHQLKSGTQAIFAGWAAGAPKRIYHVHTPIFQWQLPLWKKLTFFWANFIINMIVGNFFATHVIALTDTIKKERIKKERIREDKILVIPNGIETEVFLNVVDKKLIRKGWGILKEDIAVGNISRLTEEKGHEILIKSFAQALNFLDFPNYSNIKLIIAGDGHLRPTLEKLVEDLNIADKVLFLGQFKEEDKFKILSGFNLFVFPTLAEGFGIVLIEAMLMGLPVVCSDLSVLKEVGGNTVSFFKKGDEKSLSKFLIEMLNDSKSLKFNKKGQDRVKDCYSLDRFIKSYKKLYLNN